MGKSKADAKRYHYAGQYLTVRELSALLGISTPVIYKATQKYSGTALGKQLDASVQRTKARNAAVVAKLQPEPDQPKKSPGPKPKATQIPFHGIALGGAGTFNLNDVVKSIIDCDISDKAFREIVRKLLR